MTIQAQTVAAPVVVAVPAFVPAPITADACAVVIRSVVKAETRFIEAERKAASNRLADTVAAFVGVNVPMTAAQWDKAFRKDLKAKAEKAKVALDVASLVSRAKAIGLFVLLDGVASAPLGGETLNEYVERARKAVEHAKLPSGEYVWPHDEAGNVKKAGPATGSKKPATLAADAAASPKVVANVTDARHPLSAAKADEPGFDEKPAIAAALILTRNNRKEAELIVDVLAKHRDAFLAWAATLDKPEPDHAPAPAADAKALLAMANKVGRVKQPRAA